MALKLWSATKSYLLWTYLYWLQTIFLYDILFHLIYIINVILSNFYLENQNNFSAVHNNNNRNHYDNHNHTQAPACQRQRELQPDLWRGQEPQPGLRPRVLSNSSRSFSICALKCHVDWNQKNLYIQIQTLFVNLKWRTQCLISVRGLFPQYFFLYI